MQGLAPGQALCDWGPKASGEDTVRGKSGHDGLMLALGKVPHLKSGRACRATGEEEGFRRLYWGATPGGPDSSGGRASVHSGAGTRSATSRVWRSSP